MPFIKTESSPRAGSSQHHSDDSMSMMTPHQHHMHTLPTFHNLNPHCSLALSSPSSSHSLSHSYSHSGFSPYTSPRHAHPPTSVFDSSSHSTSNPSLSSHDIQELSSSSSPSGLASSSSLSTSVSSSLPVVDDALYNYVASAASLEGMSAEEMLRNPSVMLAVRQAMALNLTQPHSAYMQPPQPHIPQALHHHSLMARSLPGSPLPLTMPTPPPPSFHSLAAEGCGNFVPSSPVAGPARSPSLLGSGRSKRLRLDESEQRALGVGSHVPSPAPLAVLSDDSAHNPPAPSVSNCPPPTVAHLGSMFAQSLPFGAPLMPMMPPMPPMLHNRGVEHSMLMDCQPTSSPTASSATSSSSSSAHAVTDPALLMMRQHHQQQQQLLNFNHLIMRGLGGFGTTTMATPISSSSTLPTISAVALSSPSSVFASQRSVTSVSPAPSLSSVSSASSPSLATPTKSCFSRTSSSASSTPRTDDSSLDSFHSSRFSQTDDSELHLPDCDKPFACNDCHKRFSNESRLANHRRTHNNSRPYECVACNKQFNHKGSLTRHMRTHSGDKPHVCDQCGKRFYQPGNLTVHIRTHTGERPFECERCGKRFNHRSSLTVHQRSHM